MGNIVSRKTFRYRRLKTPRTIRLLDLEPGGPDDPVRLTLRHISLDDNPRYNALSYAWGDVTDTRPVWVDGKSVEVTVSLHSALHQFRHNAGTGRIRTLWADALCINQADTAEKAIQVQMMGQIYSTARFVMVWLGPSTEGVDDFLEMLPEAQTLIKEAQTELEVQNTEGEVGDGAKKESQVYLQRNSQAHMRMVSFDWQPVFSILFRPWFKRRWIIQEVGLARHVIMSAGDRHFAFTDLGDVVRGLAELPINFVLMATWGSHAHRDALVNAYYLLTMHTERETNGVRSCWELTDMVMATPWFDCTDPRDQLFSLLSLGSPDLAHIPAMRPDYTIDAAEVLTRWSTWELVDRQRPDILSLTCRPAPGVPSWVANPTTMDMLNHLGALRDYGFSTGGKGMSDFAVSSDGSILTCSAKKVDVVADLLYDVSDKPLPEADEIPEMPGSTPSLAVLQVMHRELRWLRDAERLAGQGDGSWTGPDGRLTPERFNMFWRTMFCDINSYSISGRTDDSMGPLFSDFVEEMSRILAGQGSQDPDAFASLCMLIESALDKFAGGRVFCTTQRGRLGQVIPRTREGDEIWIIRGVNVPFVMRLSPDGSGKRIRIGECYVHGIMDGEAVGDGTDFVDLSIV